MLNFIRKGLYNDIRGEIIREKFSTMGIWISPAIDVSAAIPVIGQINSGSVGWFSRPIDGNEIEVYTSLDEGQTWNGLINGKILQDAKLLNDIPSIMFKVIVKSYVAQLWTEWSPRIYSIVLFLSNKEQENWEKKITVPLEWGD